MNDKIKKLLLIIAFASLFSGCAIIDKILSDDDEDGYDDQPWNQPAGWEDKGIGLPY